MDQTVNDDAADVTVAEIDSILQANLHLVLVSIPSANLLELNCNGLSFCSKGGSGVAWLDGAGGTTPFPGSAIDPATGFGEIIGPQAPTGLLGSSTSALQNQFDLDPHATSAQIGSGDVVTEEITNNGTATQVPTTIDFVFNSVPAITSYSDNAGDSATITYPDTTQLGTPSNPIKVAAGPNGDVVMTFTIFRPQRQGVPGAGEPAFMDIGGLKYTMGYTANHIPGSGGPTPPVNFTGPGFCPTTSYSNLSPTLTLTDTAGPTPGPYGDLVDSAIDQPASPANTISFTIDLTQCYVSKGNASLPIGQPVSFGLDAASQSSSDHAAQSFTIERTR
jgi:hypothetical protein